MQKSFLISTCWPQTTCIPLSFLTMFPLSFYCIQLYIIGTALPFHFHGTNSQLHSSKMESGEGGGGAGSNATRLPAAEKVSLRKAVRMFCFLSVPLKDKSQCFPDMTCISKMAVHRDTPRTTSASGPPITIGHGLQSKHRNSDPNIDV